MSGAYIAHRRPNLKGSFGEFFALVEDFRKKVKLNPACVDEYQRWQFLFEYGISGIQNWISPTDGSPPFSSQPSRELITEGYERYKCLSKKNKNTCIDLCMTDKVSSDDVRPRLAIFALIVAPQLSSATPVEFSSSPDQVPTSTDNSDLREVVTPTVSSSLRGCRDVDGEVNIIGDYEELIKSATALAKQDIGEPIAALRSTVQECLIGAYIAGCEFVGMSLPTELFNSLKTLRATILKNHPDCAEEHNKWEFLFECSFPGLVNWLRLLSGNPATIDQKELDKISQNISRMSGNEMGIYALPAPLRKSRKDKQVIARLPAVIETERVPGRWIDETIAIDRVDKELWFGDRRSN
jgi:hypothetical protein